MTDEAVMTPQEWRDRLSALPDPMVGRSPWDSATVGRGQEAYGRAAELAAKAMLIVADEDPTLLDIPEGVDDSWDRAYYDAAWRAAEARWPGLDEWLGGITGFMFGWANNTVRYIHGKPPVGNPALVTISLPERA